MAGPRIRPRTLKGFRDYPPAVALPRERLIDTAKDVYRSFGYAPIDTPALEYTEVLLGKGGEESDKQLFRFEDAGGRDVALRFDLTVPFARFVAQHAGELGMPFKRYQVGPVWRGEKPAAGRFREFVQCDFDTIGTESPYADAECVVVIHELFRRIGLERFTVKVNDRRVLNGLLERLELADRAVPLLRALDKLPKIGRDAVAEEMAREAGTTAPQSAAVLDLAALEGPNASILERLPGFVEGSATGAAGVEGLATVLDAVRASGVPESRVSLDVSIARGLDYYTGLVVETFLDDLPGIGSCCSGGRYDDLASLYTKERLPGVGAALGLDRLLVAMQELGMVEERAASCPVFVPLFESERAGEVLALAAELRAAGLGVETYPEVRKLGAQLKYADRRGHRVAVVVGGRELDAGRAQVKDLATGATEDVGRAELVDAVRRVLGDAPA